MRCEELLLMMRCGLVDMYVNRRFRGCYYLINLLKTKRNQLYLKTQFVPRSKHFPPQL